MIDRLNLPTSIAARDARVLVRRATHDDLHAIIRLLSDDPISARRGDVANDDDEPAYAAALDRIIQDPGNELLVAVTHTHAVVGMLQLTLIPGMARRGSTRLLVEAVRVARCERSSGIGSALMRWVVEQAAIELESPLVQLTSDAARADAHRFYRKLGFVDPRFGLLGETDHSRMFGVEPHEPHEPLVAGRGCPGSGGTGCRSRLRGKGGYAETAASAPGCPS